MPANLKTTAESLFPMGVQAPPLVTRPLPTGGRQARAKAGKEKRKKRKLGRKLERAPTPAAEGLGDLELEGSDTVRAPAKSDARPRPAATPGTPPPSHRPRP